MKSVIQGHKDTIAQRDSAFEPRRFRVLLFRFCWLAALSIYILAGIGLASFHGDEAMQITMSQDYATVFLCGYPDGLLLLLNCDPYQSLATVPPYVTDSPEQLRLINGSVNRYTIGLSRHLAGILDERLPDIWQWPLSYDDNLARGNRPSDRLLNVSRLPSALFLAMSAAVMFGIGWKLGGKSLAYIASGLYAVNPIILLNGRRAMQEGSLLFFGLLTILVAILISQRFYNQSGMEAGRGKPRPYKATLLWTALILACGLTLASKHSGIVFVVGGLGWIVIAHVSLYFGRRREGLRPSPTYVMGTMGKVIVSGILIIVVFVALSPALWNDPVARLGDLLMEREKLLDSQVRANPDAPTSITQRIQGIITQPFLTLTEHYEAAFWANAQSIQNEIQRYMASPLSGLQFGIVFGLPLTLLAGIGVFRAVGSGRSWGLLAWLTVIIASLLINPLPWQRYYLPLLPIATLLTGMGLLVVIQIVQKRIQFKSPLVR
jgi:hypothetical protein